MSEKVTFRELIESIAEETENSKEFTHDFLKDFVDVINSGLKQDGTVNIAGFGKFNLKKVDEREGYNPQTEEKITIPAHNKIVFKPYKDLREIVNAPYAHLEPELIEAEEDTAKNDEEARPTDVSQEDDFIPTGPPTSHDTLEEEQSAHADEEEEKSSDSDESEAPISSSFIFEEETGVSPEEEDIVEYSGKTPEDNLDEAFDKLFGEANDSKEEAEERDSSSEATQDEGVNPEPKDREENNTESEENITADTQIPEEQQNAEQKEDQRAGQSSPESGAHPTFDRRERSDNGGSKILIFAASLIIILLIAGIAWYSGLFSGNKPGSTLASTAIPKTEQTDHKPSASSGNGKNSSPKSSAVQPKQKKPAQRTQPKQRKDKQIVISKGQTLWSIARNNYDNPRLWPWIYNHNESLKNPDLIVAGNSLSVPLPSGPQYGLTSADSVEVAKGYIATYQWYKEKGSSRARNYLWVAKRYHSNLRNIAHFKIDKEDLAFANQTR